MILQLNTSIILKKIRDSIVNRTKKGYDYNLKPFKPYTSKYAKKKKSNKVNLTLTGHMLNSLQVLTDDTIGLNNSFAQNKAKGNANYGRQFMGLSTEQQKIIQTEVYNQLSSQVYEYLKENNNVV